METLDDLGSIIAYSELLGEAFFAVDEEWRIQAANALALRFVRMNLEEVIGRSYWDVVPAARGSAQENALRGAMISRERVEIETESRVQPGRWTRGVIIPLRDGLAISFSDITRQRVAEETSRRELAESEDRLRLAQEAAAIGTYDWDVVADQIRWSPQMFDLYGIDPATPVDQVLGEWVKVLHPDDRERARNEVLGLLDRDGPFEMQFRSLGPDGHVRWIHSRGRVERDAGGQATRVIGVNIDVTERMQAELALRERSSRLEILAEAAAQVMSGGSPDTIVACLLQAAVDHLDLDVCFNLVAVEGRDDLRLTTSIGVPASVAERLRHLPMDHSICGQVALSQREAYVPKVQESADPQIEVARMLGVRAYACTPVTAGERILGTLSFGSRRRDVFTPDEISFFGTLSNYVAAVRERSRADQALRDSEERLRAIADNIPNGMVYQLQREPDGRVRFSYISQAVERLHGVSAEAVMADPEILERQILEDFRVPLDTLRRLAGSTAREVSIEMPMRVASGEERWFHRSSAPRTLPDGRIVWDGVEIDVTERRLSEAALHESEARFRHMADSAPALIWMTDAAGAVTFANMHHGFLFGVSAESLLGRHWFSVIFPEDRSRFEATFQAAFEERRPFRTETRALDRDGRVRWLRCEGVPRLDDAGNFLGYTGCNVDVTDVKLAEEHQRLLINELNHRVKNTLATVQSIAAQTLRNVDTAAQAREDIEMRLIALSRAHDVLTRENWEGANLAEVVGQAMKPYRNGDENRIRIGGPNLWLAPRTALALAMALHELATNAVKYGALSISDGRVDVMWTVQDGAAGRRLQLRWAETGGPPVQVPQRRGFGSRLIQRSLAQDLDGQVELDFAPEGVICTIDAPIEPTVSRESTFDPMRSQAPGHGSDRAAV